MKTALQLSHTKLHADNKLLSNTFLISTQKSPITKKQYQDVMVKDVYGANSTVKDNMFKMFK